MFRTLTLALSCIAATGCGAHSSNDAPASLALTSSAFRDGQPIPASFTCDGANKSPPLAWGNPPSGTRSFALVVDDPDAPGGTFRHWAAFGIPADARSIASGQALGLQGTNDKGTIGYTGPCPPPGHGLHHYHFKLFALGVQKLGVSPAARVKEVEDAAARQSLARGELVGTYERR